MTSYSRSIRSSPVDELKIAIQPAWCTWYVNFIMEQRQAITIIDVITSIIIWLEAALQLNIGFTFELALMVFTRSDITPPNNKTYEC